MKTLLTILFLLCLPLWSEAATTWNAANCTRDEIQTQVNSAQTGDTVTLPDCDVTFSQAVGSVAPTDATYGNLVLIHGKNITVQGNGIGHTKFTTWSSATSAGTIFRIGQQGYGNSSRITGVEITVTRSTNPTSKVSGHAFIVDGDGWRIDHNKVTCADVALCEAVTAPGFRTTVSYGPTGLVDHNTITNARILVTGYPDQPTSPIRHLWASALGLGDVNAMYVEDNTILFTCGCPDEIDANYGGRFVARYNDITGGSEITPHSLDAWRGTRRWEVYRNTIHFNVTYFSALTMRGGTGTIFDNTIEAGFSNTGINIDNVRSFSSTFQHLCDGTQAQDGNRLANGWPCRDQIGWNTDDFEWTAGTPNPPQKHEAAYFWGNTVASVPAITHVANNSDAWLVADRDYYTSGTFTVNTACPTGSTCTPFNGTTGVGFGPIALRPQTCTTYNEGAYRDDDVGVAYWATDEGEWDSTNGATADGRLYRCTATDTWTLYYTPYTYPHPLQGYVGGGNAPAAPTGVRAVQTTGTAVSLIWTPNTEANLAGYKIYRSAGGNVYGAAVRTVTPASAATAHTSITSYFATNLETGVNSFAVSAFYTDGTESLKSTDVLVTGTGLSRAALTQNRTPLP